MSSSYLETARMLIAWCELRRDFRGFRVDRIKDAVFLDERYPERAAVLRATWLASWRREPARAGQRARSAHPDEGGSKTVKEMND